MDQVQDNQNLLQDPLLSEEYNNTKQQQQQQQQIQSSKNWLSRTFSPLTPGSIRGSILSLSGLILGVGVLALPKVATDSGIIVGICFTLISGLINYLSLLTITKCYIKTKETKLTVITYKLLGKSQSNILQIVLICLQLGCAINFFITISKFFMQVIQQTQYIEYIQTPLLQRTIIILGSTLIVFPASVPNTIGILHNFVAIGIFAVLYIVIVIIIQTPEYASVNFKLNHIKLFEFNLRIFTGFGVCLFSYACQSIITSVLTELQNPRENRIKKIFQRSIYINTCVYIVTMCVGYISFPQAAPDLITDRLPLNPTDNDIIINIGKIFMLVHLFTAIPLLIIPCKNQILNHNVIQPYSHHTYIRILITFILVYSSAAIAIFFPKIYDFLGLIGGTCCVYLAVFLPGLLHIRISDKHQTHWSNLLIFITIYLLTIFGIFAALLSFLRAINILNF